MSQQVAQKSLDPRWLAQSFRLSVFFAENKYQDEHFFKSFCGIDPTEEKKNFHDHVVVQSGPYMDGAIVAVKAISRLDFHFIGVGDPTLAGLTGLGAFAERSEHIRNLCYKWLLGTSNIFRIAWGVAANLPVASHDEAYENLGRYLHAVKVPGPGEGSDLVFSVNRPKKQKFDATEIKINRISTWRAQKVTVAIVNQATGLAQADAGITKFYMTAELDVNTDAERFDVITPELSASIYDQLFRYSSDFLAEGDVL